MEHTLSPRTGALAKCNNQPGIQYSGVHPTASSALSHVRTHLFVLCLDRLNTIDVVKFLFAMNISLQILKPDSKINQPSISLCFGRSLNTFRQEIQLSVVLRPSCCPI